MLTSRYAAKAGLARAGELLGLVHDLGKYGGDFQDYIQSGLPSVDIDADSIQPGKEFRRGEIDHSTAGGQYVYQALSRSGQLGTIAGQVLALCAVSHHSGLIECIAANKAETGVDRFHKRITKSDELTHLQESLGGADHGILQQISMALQQNGVVHEIQLAITSIVRSSPGKAPQGIVAQMQIGLLVRFLLSCLLDADRISTAQFMAPAATLCLGATRPPEWESLLSRLERHLEGFEQESRIAAIRTRIAGECRAAGTRPQGMYSLTVPPGGGKTLSSLLFAMTHANRHGLDRVIFVVPFTSIIDQNADVIREVLEPGGLQAGRIVLEHHSNLAPDEKTWRNKVLSENWDAPVVLTTMVQFLEAVFGGGTRSARRMHALARSVIVFDEIQTLPVRCVHLFNNAVNFLTKQCGSSTLLCTATQPLLGQVDPGLGALQFSEGHELMIDVQGLFRDLERVELLDRRKPGGWTEQEVADLACNEATSAGSCLVIVNTKAAARAIFRLCSGHHDAEVFHLSTSMCPAHRRAVLGEVRKRLKPGQSRPVICVSTQLIEAGVDVDFGTVIRFLAGMDSIAQAAGRCNRHGNRVRGQMWIVNPAKENLDLLPDIRIGRGIACRILDEFLEAPATFDFDPLGPKAMARYFHYHFFDRRLEMSYPLDAREIGHSGTLLDLLACNSVGVAEHMRVHGKAPETFLRQAFATAGSAFRAIDSATRGVLVPFGTEGTEIIDDLRSSTTPEGRAAILARAQPYAINVFPNVLDRLMAQGAITELVGDSGVLTLGAEHYSSDFGLCEPQKEVHHAAAE